jgi:hypothetical protein
MAATTRMGFDFRQEQACPAWLAVGRCSVHQYRRQRWLSVAYYHHWYGRNTAVPKYELAKRHTAAVP